MHKYGLFLCLYILLLTLLMIHNATIGPTLLAALLLYVTYHKQLHQHTNHSKWWLLPFSAFTLSTLVIIAHYTGGHFINHIGYTLYMVVGYHILCHLK